MERPAVCPNRKTQGYKHVRSPLADSSLNAISVKYQQTFFLELDKVGIKFIQKKK